MRFHFLAHVWRPKMGCPGHVWQDGKIAVTPNSWGGISGYNMEQECLTCRLKRTLYLNSHP